MPREPSACVGDNPFPNLFCSVVTQRGRRVRLLTTAHSEPHLTWLPGDHRFYILVAVGITLPVDAGGLLSHRLLVL